MPINLTRLHFAEIKEEICVEVGIISSENHVALQCSNNQLITLDLLDSSANVTDFPFNLYYAEISQSHNPGALKRAELKKCYKDLKLLEKQRLVLEQTYVDHFTCERLKVNALQFQQAPWKTTNNRSLATIVTVSGLCQILQKLPAPSRNWGEICSVNEYILSITSPKTNPITDYFSSECRVTAANWHKREPILFVSFENCYIAVLTLYNLSTLKFKEYCIAKTEFEEICDITSFEDYLLVSSRCGVLQLFYVNSKGNSLTLTPSAVLWNRKDNITCSKVIFTSFSSSLYLVVLNKGSHILAFMLSTSGELLCSTQLYIGAIKVTGLQFISSNEFLLTTITRSVRCFRVQLLERKEINLREQFVEIDLGSENIGILGFVASANCSLLTFVLFRYGEYSQQCKHTSSSIFVNISKVERRNILKMPSPESRAININQDSVIALGMDMFNNAHDDQYSYFPDILHVELPDILDDEFLRRLQMKFVVTSNLMSFRQLKRKKIEDSILLAHKLLGHAVRISHIICRLKYLLSLEPISLSSFQKKCICTFINKYILLIRKLKMFTFDNILELTKERYLMFFSTSFDVQKYQKVVAWNERCLYCNDPTNPDTMMCFRNHKVKRCPVSYQQLPVLSFRHCPRCEHYVLEDESLLQQLFTANESISCIFCRLQFVEDCI